MPHGAHGLGAGQVAGQQGGGGGAGEWKESLNLPPKDERYRTEVRGPTTTSGTSTRAACRGGAPRGFGGAT